MAQAREIKAGYIESLEKKAKEGDLEAKLILGMTPIILGFCGDGGFHITRDTGFRYLSNLAINSDNTKEGRCAATFLAICGRNEEGKEDAKSDPKMQFGRLERLLSQERVNGYIHARFLATLLSGKRESEVLKFADSSNYPLALYWMGHRIKEQEVGEIDAKITGEARDLAWYKAAAVRFAKAATAGFEPAQSQLNKLNTIISKWDAKFADEHKKEADASPDLYKSPHH